ncbi:MAG: radical SAM family heme chaperone HemW [Clostridia bacterium]|nr:radical SAM family heme chaperone HemW [Clostridia bacterium]
MKTTRGLYIHIPFCLSKCTYCDFYYVAIDTEIVEKYVNALIEEIKFGAIRNDEIIVDTIYIGGGTPSVLSPFVLEKIVKAIHDNFSLDIKEFTIEANPATNIEFVEYKNLGINRISLGVQTLNDKLLGIIGRRHDAKLALDTIEKASRYFDNLSCDLMIGLPTQTLNDVESSALTLVDKVKHVSTYMLKLSDNVKMAKQIRQGIYSLPDDDAFADYYDLIFNIFRINGLDRYEISNFSFPGYESLHNLKYWNREEYIGLGVAAHGFFGNVRYYNPSSINSYILGNNYGFGKEKFEIISKESALFEKIMLSLRLPKGINIDSINKEFGIDFESKYRSQLEFLKPFLDFRNNTISIKEDKLLLESAIAREFLV